MIAADRDFSLRWISYWNASFDPVVEEMVG
jgi:hypothetical protein